MSGSPLDPLVDLATHLAVTIGGIALVVLSLVMFLRWLGLHWSWALPGLLLFPALWSFDQEGAGVIAATALFATVTGARWHHDDLRHGGDRAQDARDRRTPLDATRARMERRGARGGRWVDRRGLSVGRDERRRTVRIPVGHRSGRHTLVVGATGSGKTVTQAWIAGRLVREGYGAVVIDPKGDRLLHDELEHAARKSRRTFRVWTPEGPAVYNPFAHGTDTELADKVLAGETYTEPHYLRQAQRYLGHAVRSLRASGRPITVMTLAEAMVPDHLEYLGRALPPNAGRPPFRATSRGGGGGPPPPAPPGPPLPRRAANRVHPPLRPPPPDPPRGPPAPRPPPPPPRKFSRRHLPPPPRPPPPQ